MLTHQEEKEKKKKLLMDDNQNHLPAQLTVHNY